MSNFNPFTRSLPNPTRPSHYDTIPPASLLNPVKPKTSIMHEFRIIRQVGLGGFGSVHKARSNIDDSVRAIKVIPVKQRGRDFSEEIQQEIAILHQVDHDAIIKCYKSYLDSQTAQIVLEFAPGGDLEDMLDRHTTISERETKLILLDLGSALEYLHERNIILREIKLANVMIGFDERVRLSDFGLATRASSEGKTYGICGTTYARAPEMLTQRFYDASVDWWGLGVILYQLVVGKEPFEESDGRTLEENIISGPLVIPSSVSQDCREVIEGLLNRDVERRTNCTEDLLLSKFFSDVISTP